MVSLLTPGTEKFSNYKCGDVFCETPTTYNVNCCVCDKKLPLHQFPQHFQQLHISKGKIEDETEAEVKEEEVQMNVDLNLSSLENEDFFKNEYPKDSDSYSSDDDVPIAFMEVELPKLKGKKLNEFLPEHETMILDCYEALEHNQESNQRDSDYRVVKAQAQKNESRQRTATKRVRMRERKFLKQANKAQKSTKNTPNSVSKEAKTEQQQQAEQCTEQDSNVNFKEGGQAEQSAQRGDDNNHSDINLEIEIPEQFNCSICTRYCKSKRGLAIHMRMMHDSAHREPGKDPNDSSSQDKSSSDFVCNICNKKFAYIGNLNTHKKRHTDEKSFQCPECGIFFHTDHEMKSHYMSHTDLLPVICEVCGRGFRNTGKLKAHMRRHTGERPAKCEICAKSFFSFHDLNVHRATHTTERPFSCEVCRATFRTKKAVRVHKKLHITEREYECNLCGKNFLNEHGLTSHMQQVHLKCVP